MSGAYVDKNYVYAVARVRGQELKLLSGQSISELVSVKNTRDIKRILKEKGWGSDSDADFLQMIHAEKEKLWEFIDEIVPDQSQFAVFRLANDYHNLKAAIKESSMDYSYEGIYIEGSTIPTRLIRECVKNKAYGDLPADMVDVAREAHDIFLKTADGQLCDVIVDKACLDAILKAGKTSKSNFLKMYAELSVVSSNIKVCVRAALTGKDKDWVDKAVASCDTLDRDMMINATVNGVDAICNYLSSTDYADAVVMIKKSLTAFEKWCDDLLIDRMKGMLYESFGLGPIVAYILAKENEIKTVRIIYTGIQNGFSEEMIRERVRETYV